MTNTKIKLPAICARVVEIEDVLFEQLQKGVFESNVIIDMEDVEFITAPSLIFLIAITNQFKKENKDIEFWLPAKKEVRDILRVMKFREAISEVTGKFFNHCVRVEDVYNYFGEEHNPDALYNWFCKKDGGLKEYFKKSFFSITSLPFDTDLNKSNSVDEEVNKWDNQNLLEILRNHLEGFTENTSEMLPGTIVWETMTNAQRHGKASKIYTASFFNRKHKHFTLSYWDDGINIYKTLLKALKDGLEIRMPNSSSNQDNIINHFSFLSKNKNNKSDFEYIYSDSTPNIKTEEYNILIEKKLLIASLFPGITSDVAGKTFRKKAKKSLQNIDEPGNGLSSLLNVVIDILNGNVAIRVGKYFINIKKPTVTEYKKYKENEPAYRFDKLYSLTISDYSKYDFDFEGNMITIRLTLK